MTHRSSSFSRSRHAPSPSREVASTTARSSSGSSTTSSLRPTRSYLRPSSRAEALASLSLTCTTAGLESHKEALFIDLFCLKHLIAVSDGGADVAQWTHKCELAVPCSSTAAGCSEMDLAFYSRARAILTSLRSGPRALVWPHSTPLSQLGGAAGRSEACWHESRLALLLNRKEREHSAEYEIMLP